MNSFATDAFDLRLHDADRLHGRIRRDRRRFDAFSDAVEEIGLFVEIRSSRRDVQTALQFRKAGRQIDFLRSTAFIDQQRRLVAAVEFQQAIFKESAITRREREALRRVRAAFRAHNENVKHSSVASVLHVRKKSLMKYLKNQKH